MATDFRPTKYFEEVVRVGLDETMELIRTINADIQPDLMAGNKTVIMQHIDDISLSSYTGANFTYSNADFTELSFTLATSQYFAETILQSNMNNETKAKKALGTIGALAVDALRKAFNTKVCAHYADVDADNILAADGAFVTLTAANVFKQLSRFVVEFDKAGVPDPLRHIIVPPEVMGLIQTVTNYTGVIGRLNANIHMCNEMSTTGSGDDKIWRILGYHKWFIMGGFGIDSIESGYETYANHAFYINGLFNYDTDVPTALDGYGWTMSAKIDMTA